MNVLILYSVRMFLCFNVFELGLIKKRKQTLQNRYALLMFYKLLN
jgi:hypothetical protein